MNSKILNRLKTIALALLPLLGAGVEVSCSEDSGVEDEYANWTSRNDVYFASLADSLSQNPTQWRKIKSVYLSSVSEGSATDYIYVKVLDSGTETVSPVYTDSVRISYQGRIIPTTSYPQGYPFDGTVYGTYNTATNSTAKFRVSSLVDGMSTALQYMHRGDHWRVYIPSTLGYLEQDKTSTGIPPHSVLIFEMTLIDFSHAGEVMPVWSSRRNVLEEE